MSTSGIEVRIEVVGITVISAKSMVVGTVVLCTVGERHMPGLCTYPIVISPPSQAGNPKVQAVAICGSPCNASTFAKEVVVMGAYHGACI